MNGIRPVGRFGPLGLTVRLVTASENNIYFFLSTVTVRKLKLNVAVDSGFLNIAMPTSINAQRCRTWFEI